MKEIIDFLAKESNGNHTEFRVVILPNGSGYAHVVGRDSETLDFSLNLTAEPIKSAEEILDHVILSNLGLDEEVEITRTDALRAMHKYASQSLPSGEEIEQRLIETNLLSDTQAEIIAYGLLKWLKSKLK